MIKLIQLKYDSLKSDYRDYRRRFDSAEYYKKFELNNPGDYSSTHCFDYYKCIFIHIPKTAGLSISKTLFGNYAGTHLSINHYIAKFGRKTVDKYFKFTFARNPWERLYSAFTFLKRGGINEKDMEFADKYLSGVKNFESFVMDWLNEESMFGYWHFVPQYHFITLKEDRNKMLIDFVGRFENLEADFKHVCEVLKLGNKNLLKINTNKTDRDQSYMEMYNEEMIKKVAHLYKMDIQLFNYSFDKYQNRINVSL